MAVRSQDSRHFIQIICMLAECLQDNSDAQYRSFRNNIPALAVASCVYLFFKFIWVASGISPPENNLYLIPFNLVFSALLMFALHGTSIIKLLIILTINYGIAKTCRGRRVAPVLTWLFNGAILFANDRYAGYRFGDILPALEYLVSFFVPDK